MGRGKSGMSWASAVTAGVLLLGGASLAQADASSSAANELKTTLSGATFSGTYLRAGTPYTMAFGEDGRLSDSAGREGRWWVDESGDYCREWETGPMAGVTTCMEVIIHMGRVAIYSGDEKMLEGELVPGS